AEVRCAGRYAPSRQASASVRASRRSVFTRRLRLAYIGAKFGSATITSWPSPSTACATHSLSVDASSSTRAPPCAPSSAANRSRLVRPGASMSPRPPSSTMQTWLSRWWTSIPMYSIAGLPPLVGGTEVYHWTGSQPLHPIYLHQVERGHPQGLALD